MRPSWRAIGLVTTGVLALGALSVGSVHVAAERRIARTYHVETEDIAIPDDPASLARGRHLVEVVAACTTCHGADLSGLEMADDPWLGRLWASNLTPGRGGIAELSDAELVRAIRYGLRPDDTPLLMMPAQHFYHLSDADVGAIVAWLRRLPPVDRKPPGRRMGTLAALAIVTGRVPELVPADLVVSRPPRIETPQPRPDAAYGAYLVETGGCRVCHRQDLKGGRHPLSLPEEPPPPDLTPGGRLAGWSEVDFIDTLRTGITPEGHRLDPRWMPWPSLARMSDVELRAIYRYLRALPGEPAV